MTLQFAIYTAPPIPVKFTTLDPLSKDAGLWSPLSCTLIYTTTTALLVDCPPSIAATAELASWIKSTLPSSSTLRYFVASHAHGDHMFGFPVLKDAFPDVSPVATSAVVEGIKLQYAPPLYDGLWQPSFPTTEAGTGLPEDKVDFIPLPPSNEIDLDNHPIKLYDVGHGDTHASCFLYAPELGLVVAGDIAYNGDCYQYLGEATTQAKRDQWVAALLQVAELKPKVVVPGHTFKPVTEPDEARALAMLEGTKAYIKGFEEELEKAVDAEDLFGRMRSRYDRWNLVVLIMSCQASMAAKLASA